MKNIFDKEEQKMQHEIFTQITDSISNWMINNYPTIESDLSSKFRSIQEMQSEMKILYKNHRIDMENEKENTKKYLISELINYIKLTIPDLDQNLQLIASELKKQTNKISKNSEEVEKKLQKIIQNSSIYEDVYKIRDEMKEISKFIQGFKKKIVKAFDMGDT